MRFVMVATASVLLLGGCAVPVAGTARPAAGPAVGASAAAAGTFDDPQGRFALVPPAGWVVDTSGASGTAALFLDPRPDPAPTGEFTANLNVLIVPTTTALPATVDAARQEVSSVRGYAGVEDAPVTLADGTQGHLLGGRFVDRSGFALRNVQLFAVQGDRTIVVTGTALADSWDRYSAAFDSALHTVTVGPPTAATGSSTGGPPPGGAGLAE